MRLPRLLAALLPLLLAACAVGPRPQAALSTHPGWAFEQSDLPVDPGFRFGRLDNGLRYVVRRNATPAGTAEVRMEVEAGSLDERASEQGFAHYVEHMAFNGSTHVPEGEMVKLLQRDGLAFGADTNAATSFENTLYKLTLPRNDPKLLDTALMLMRETASELMFSPAAVDRERGVVMSELRDGKGYALDNYKTQVRFLHPRATYTTRLPIGTPETLAAATGASLRGFWSREYVPAKTVVIVVGDFDPDATEAAIRGHFADWRAAPPVPRPDQGKVEPGRKGMTEIHLDPALSERVTVSRNGRWLNERDTAAQRRTGLLRAIGYGVVNRRLARISRQANPPFRAAGFGTSEVFHIGRTTNLVIDCADGHWRDGIAAAGATLRRALAQGFTQAEIDEQLANVRTSLEVAAAGADTRNHNALVGLVLGLVRDDKVPVTPANALERFEKIAPQITPAVVLAAMQGEALPLADPLIRFAGRKAPVGGAAALRAAWEASQRGPLSVASAEAAQAGFGYTDFGTPGTIVADSVEPVLGIRTIRFANGVRLNLKRTTLEKDRVLVRVAIDGGQMLDTKEKPLATEMMSVFAAGGTGKHSEDDLQTLLAGRSVAGGLGRGPDAFVQTALTTPRDLALEFQLLAAYVTDPGYRPEGETIYRQNAANFFLRYRSTPAGALGFAQGGILSDDDPRFSYRPLAEYRALTFAQLKDAITDRLKHGAIEIGMVGDFDEAAAIAAVAGTFGALPAREAEFGAYPAQRQRPFTAKRGLTVIRHAGDPSQAIVRLVWPTRDDADTPDTLKLDLLQEVVRNAVIEEVREALGKSYSPSASSSVSGVWTGYGTFAIQASVDVSEVPAVRAALARVVQELNDRPIDADTLQRARAPMLERYDNALKSNGFWLELVDSAQSKPRYIKRYAEGRAFLAGLTAKDVAETARRWLVPGKAVEMVVVPDGAAAPAK